MEKVWAQTRLFFSFVPNYRKSMDQCLHSPQTTLSMQAERTPFAWDTIRFLRRIKLQPSAYLRLLAGRRLAQGVGDQTRYRDAGAALDHQVLGPIASHRPPRAEIRDRADLGLALAYSLPRLRLLIHLSWLTLYFAYFANVPEEASRMRFSEHIVPGSNPTITVKVTMKGTRRGAARGEVL